MKYPKEDWLQYQINLLKKKIANGGGEITGKCAVVDVDNLPTENIDASAIYRLRKLGTYIVLDEGILDFELFAGGNIDIRNVDSLPSEGENATVDDTKFILYYSKQDNAVYGYINQETASSMGVAKGWYGVGVLLTALGLSIPYGGVLDSYESLHVAVPNTIYNVWDYTFYTYSYSGSAGDVDPWKNQKTALSIRKGTGSGSLIFNDMVFSVASGGCASAFGSETYAQGGNSFSSGFLTTAQGECSHVEGTSSHANGDNSHAEGSGTNAGGKNSHSEGEGTTALGDCQHVQGRNNIEDSENKYAHIVGNGIYWGTPSNAHTLDWEGNAWFSGKVRVGGSSWEDGYEFNVPSYVNLENFYEDVDEYKHTNNEDLYIFNFNKYGGFKINNYSNNFTPQDQNVKIQFNFGFCKGFATTGRFISKNSLNILKEIFPDIDSFSFGMEGQESCFITYPPTTDAPIYFKISDNEIEVFVGIEE